MMVIVFDKPKRVSGMWMCGYARQDGKLVPVLIGWGILAQKIIDEHRPDVEVSDLKPA